MVPQNARSCPAWSIANTRVLLLVNYRPECRHGWSSKTYYAQLRLDPLGQESAEELLDAGSYAVLRERGKQRLEGRDYVMRDGDVIHVRFNV